MEEGLTKVQEQLILKMEAEEAERSQSELLRTKEEEEEADRAEFRENAAVADEQLRLAQERQRRKWVSKFEKAGAASAEAES